MLDKVVHVVQILAVVVVAAFVILLFVNEPAQPAPVPKAGSANTGAAIYATRCASCHGDNFAGSKAAARIAGQHQEYITTALHDYKSGVRSGGGVAAMAEVAYPLSDDEITALAHYLARF